MASSDTRRLKVIVTGDSGQASQALEQVGHSAEKSESKLSQLAKTVASFAGKGVIALGAIGAAAATMGFSTASQLEQVEVGFTTMLGSAQKAQKFMKELQTFANSTPFEFTELTSSAQQFLAMGFAAKDIIPMLTAVGDAVAAMGGSAENIDAVTRALGQMQAKGKVSGEELMQLTEQGIPALKILADSYGVSTAEMSKMVTKGQVMSDKAIPLLIKGLENGTKSVKGFGGMMDKQAETMKGKWSTFMDTLQMGLGNIAVNFLPMAKKGIDLLSASFGNFFAGLQGKGKLAGFSGTLNEIGMGMKAMISSFKEGDVTSDGLVGKFEKLGVLLRNMYDAGIAVAQSTATMVGWFREHEKITTALAITMGTLVAITKTYAIVTYVQAAGGLLAMFKNLTMVQGVMKVATAVQWAYNLAVSAASYLQIAGYIGILNIAQKANVVWTKAMAAATFLWGLAMRATPLGLIITGITLLVAAVLILWKNNEGFRNFVLNVLWPALKKAWTAILNTVMTVVHALVAAFNWSKNAIMTAWNAVAAFMGPIIAKIVNFMQPIVHHIGVIAGIILGFYNAVWKIVWILIQIAVKLFVMYFTNVVVPAIKIAINLIGAGIRILYNVFWKPMWNAMMAIMRTLIGWVMNYFVPGLKKAWGWIQTGVRVLRDAFVTYMNFIVGKARAVFTAISGPVVAIWRGAVEKFKSHLNILKAGFTNVFDGAKNKVNEAMNRIVASFNKARDGIKKAWDSVVSITKKPINFVVNDVYNNRILPLWNKVAEKFGISTRLDKIKGFARGGVVPGPKGHRDTELAMLTRGEGILSTRDMDKLGGPSGFNEFRKSLAMYNGGGIAGSGGVGDGIGGWFKSLASKGKDIFQGIAGKVISPLVSSIRGFINNNLQGGGMSGLMRGGANTILNKLVGWVTKKDKEIPSIGGAGGVGMGYRAQQALISRAFPGLGMISGFRPGARTLSGNQSYHAIGRAVDYPPNRALALWIRSNFGAKTKELITPWNELNLHNGRPHRYTGAVWNQHNFPGGNAHDHWAMDGISTVQPGWFKGYNGTGKPETLINKDLLSTGPITINIYGATDPARVAKQVRDELVKLGKRNGGSVGLPTR